MTIPSPHDDSTTRPELAPPIDCGRRRIELRQPRPTDRGALVDLIVCRDGRNVPTSRWPCALSVAQAEQLVAALAAVVAAARPRACPAVAPVASPARPRRLNGLRRPGEPPASWTAMQSAHGGTHG